MTDDEREAIKTTRCLFCAALPGVQCTASNRYGPGTKPSRRPHRARVKSWRVALDNPGLRELPAGRR